ncbi:tRNA lysidine(34) synthetase TilS [Planomonospora parontospora]|uniref:tRNA lysidine(34) synthetase TilS n=1 Tax=Planomonospora parontospora TaxID=58119 RepID=UPI00167002A7|nr:tRNA lysidine(34) synthetase TilS [Planomonospora parontospora]GGL28269.1 tRNA(Ile)-lysidine synthase [Planomonospora parontospora subsp. antibiotica]GII18015.1 tRNA(Ile)-lysidine synthase [Planomonospora parontospora subsp. antibiotica]
MGPHPAVADVRRAVRLSLADLEPGGLVLAACSGGADSLALAAGLAFVAPRAGLRAGLLTVDHGLQSGSARQAAAVAGLPLGLDPVEVLTVTVGTSGGPENAAREARYAALSEAAGRLGAAAVLLGHTRDDQAETVLLRLARGSGTRSLAGMPARTGIYRRPLLELGRGTTVAACAALGLVPWEDPHNLDGRYARVRVRTRLLPALEDELGPGVAEALARTAGLCRDDADALDAWAEEAYGRAVAGERDPVDGDRRPAAGDCALSDIPKGVALAVPVLEGLPAAVRRRVLRRAAITAGAPPGALSAGHILQVERLVTAWRGQRSVGVPGGIGAVRRCGTLIFVADPPRGDDGDPDSRPLP